LDYSADSIARKVFMFIWGQNYLSEYYS